MKKVYHYTSVDSLTKIISTSSFFPSYLNPQMDTAFGEGWYFTDLPPETPDADLQQALWMRIENEKSRRYLAFEIHPDLLEYCRPHVYRLRIGTVTEGHIKLTITYTLTSTGTQAIRYVQWGQKQVVNKPYNRFGNVFGSMAVISLGILALTQFGK